MRQGSRLCSWTDLGTNPSFASYKVGGRASDVTLVSLVLTMGTIMRGPLISLAWTISGPSPVSLSTGYCLLYRHSYIAGLLSELPEVTCHRVPTRGSPNTPILNPQIPGECFQRTACSLSNVLKRLSCLSKYWSITAPTTLPAAFRVTPGYFHFIS